MSRTDEEVGNPLEGVARTTERLVPNRPDVIDEVFDGEAVLVNLRTGCYYSLNGSASEIWALLGTSGRPAAEILQEVSDRYDLKGDAASAVERFVERLRAEGLAVDTSATTAREPLPPVTHGTANGYTPPEMTRFDDMQDLLLLDPIHDIDLEGEGWPVPREGRAPG